MPRTRRKSLFKKIKTHRLPLLFLAAAVLLLLFPTLYKKTSPSQAQVIKHNITSQGVIKKQVNESIKIDANLLTKKEGSQNPQRILIPDYKLDLPIAEANVVNGVWEVSETTASHGVGSANPGENGNTVVFAHARDDLFGPIRNIKVGDEIYILTKDRWHKYQVSETKLVDPNQVEVVAPTAKETLTLFTCTGFLDEKRLVVKALPI